MALPSFGEQKKTTTTSPAVKSTGLPTFNSPAPVAPKIPTPVVVPAYTPTQVQVPTQKKTLASRLTGVKTVLNKLTENKFVDKAIDITTAITSPRQFIFGKGSDVIASTYFKPKDEEQVDIAKKFQKFEDLKKTAPTDEVGNVTLPKEKGVEALERIFVEEKGASAIPFLSGAVDIKEMTQVGAAFKRLESGTADEYDLMRLSNFVDETSRDKTRGAQVASIVSGSAAFAGELLATAGIGAGAKAASVKATKEALEQALTKEGTGLIKRKVAEMLLKKEIAPRVVGGLVKESIRAPIAGATRTGASTLRNMLPQVDWNSLTKDEAGKYQATITEEGDNVGLSLTKALGETYVETLSERAGDLFGLFGAGKVISDLAAKTAIGNAFIKLNAKIGANASVQAFNDIVRKAGWNGIISEMLEERVGDVGYGILSKLGLSDQGFKIPSKDDLLTEFIAFSIPGTIIGLTQTMLSKLGGPGDVSEAMDALNEDVQEEIKKNGVPAAVDTLVTDLGFTPEQARVIAENNLEVVGQTTPPIDLTAIGNEALSEVENPTLEAPLIPDAVDTEDLEASIDAILSGKTAEEAIKLPKAPKVEKVTPDVTVEPQKPTKEVVLKDIKKYETAKDYVEAKHPTIEWTLSENDGDITISKIVVPKKEQARGVGMSAMEDLIKYADLKRKQLLFTPSKETESFSNTNLKDLGFVKNTDSSIKATLVRVPKASTKTQDSEMEAFIKEQKEKGFSKFEIAEKLQKKYKISITKAIKKVEEVADSVDVEEQTDPIEDLKGKKLTVEKGAFDDIPVIPALTKEEVADLEKIKENKEEVQRVQNLNTYVGFFSKLIEGNLSVEEFKQGFADFIKNKENIRADLEKMSKDQLLKRSMFSRTSDKKDKIIDQILSDMQMRFSIGRTVSFTIGAGSSENAITALVEKTTQEDIDKYIGEVTQMREDRAKRMEEFKKSVENPQTLDEFKTFIEVRGKENLNEEQIVKYEDLIAEQAKEKEAKQLKDKGVIAGVKADTTMTLEETTNTKTGEPLFKVKMADRVDKEQYQALNTSAKKLGGYYSRFAKGFLFKDKASAENFIEVGKGERVETTRPEEMKAEKEQNTANKLRDMSEKLEIVAEEKLNRDRKTNTVRRANMADNVEADARKELAIAKTMRNLANAIASGDAKLLNNLSTKTQIIELDRILASANYAQTREGAKETGTFKTDVPIDNKTVEYVKEFIPTFWITGLEETAKKASDKKGLIRASKNVLNFVRMTKASGREDGTPNKFVMEDIITINDGLSQEDVNWQMRDAVANFKRLQALGIGSIEQLRATLREYIQFKETPADADKVKQLERAVVGKKLGIDFFPTPTSVAEQMVEMADIQEGMKVLEPSAGNGNIADVIRETGVSPDVAEISGALRDILEAKGYNVVSQDFMDITENYDRIVMNPPFSNNMDIEHVRKAYDLLNPGGKVVSIVGEGAFFRQGKKETEFREWLDDLNASVEELPQGTFMNSELLATTGTNARIIQITKQDSKYKLSTEGLTLKTLDRTLQEVQEGLNKIFGRDVPIEEVFNADTQLGNPDALAQALKSNIKLLSRNKSFSEAIANHEGWHWFKMQLSLEEQAEIREIELAYAKANPEKLEKIRKVYEGIINTEAGFAEELMADTLADYTKTGKTTVEKIKVWFDKLIMQLKLLFSGRKDVLSMFRNIKDTLAKTTGNNSEGSPKYKKLSDEDVANIYYNEVIKPAMDAGKPTVIGADDLKDYFGQDYDDARHPVYSKAAFELYKRALNENPVKTVVFTGGGPASGKTELVTKGLVGKGFKGVIYDSNMSGYEGAVRQIELAREAGKEVEIHGVLPNIEKARGFSIKREYETGRGISDTTFARGHTGFPAVVKALIENGIVRTGDVNIIDTRNVETFEDAFDMVARGEYLEDPLATLSDLKYSEEDFIRTYAKENYDEATGKRRAAIPGSKKSSGIPSLYRPDREDADGRRDARILGKDLKTTVEPKYKLQKNPEFNTGDKFEDAKLALEHVENRVGALPAARKIKVSGAQIPLPEDLEQKVIALESEREFIDNHPAAPLQKFALKTGEFKGVLPEVTGKTDRFKNKFSVSGDDIVTELGFNNSEEARESFEDFKQRQANFVEREKDVREEVKDYKNEKKDEIALQKIAAMEERKNVAEEKLRADKEAQKRREDAFEAGLKATKLEEEARQKKIRSINSAKTERVKELSTFAKVIGQKLNPLKYTDKITQNIFNNWNGKLLQAEQRANVETDSFKDIPIKDGIDTILDYEAGKPTAYSKRIKEKFDALRAEANARGVDLGFRENYLPHVYAETSAEIREKIRKYLVDRGLSEETINAYENGEMLSNEVVKVLKINPFFNKERVFPTYKVAMEYGLTPKYTTVQQLIGHYVKELETIVANNELVQELESAGKILPFEDAPALTWQMVNLPFSQKGYMAPPNIAKVINGLFGIQEPSLWTYMAKLSKKMQEIALSAGIPYTTINFFAIGQLIKEVTAGNFKAANAFFRANFNRRSMEWLQENRNYMYMMARQGVNLRKTVDSWENLHTNFSNLSLKDAPTRTLRTIFTKDTVFSETFDKLFNKRTFMSFMPMMQVQLFKDVYNKFLEHGYPADVAEEFAGRVIRNNFGLTKFSARSKETQDKLAAIFFAPQFREGIINTLANTAGAGVDFTKNVGGLREPLNPTLSRNRKLLVGMMITYALYNLLNAVLNDDGDPENGPEFMWDNPKNRQFALQIPTDDGTLVYVEFMPSFLAFARNMFSGTVALLTGDIETATQKYGSLLSMPIKLVSEVFSNKDYFGNPIYNETDTGQQKVLKIAEHAGLAVNHPYIKELLNQLQDKKPLYQSIIAAFELPLKFSTKDKVAQGEYYDALDKKAKDNARMKEKVTPVYEQVQVLKQEGRILEATDLYNTLSDEEKIMYNKIKNNPKERRQEKEALFEEAVASMGTGTSLGQAQQVIAKELYGTKPTTAQQSTVAKDFAYFRIFNGYKYKKEADELKALSNENKVLYMKALREKISASDYNEFLSKSRQLVKLSSGASSPVLISDEVLKQIR